MSKLMLSLLSFTTLLNASIVLAGDSELKGWEATDSYCLALRGNGTAIAGHWGALSRVVEKNGFPSAASGGSSASLSLFLLESISLNPMIQNDGKVDKVLASLLLKTLPEVFIQAFYPQGNYLYDLALSFERGGDLTPYIKFINPEFLFLLKDTYDKILTLPLENQDKFISHQEYPAPKQIQLAIQNVNQRQVETNPDHKKTWELVQFRAKEIQIAVNAISKFRMDKDANFLLRPGLVNFDFLSKTVAKLADFYAGIKYDLKLKSQMQDFFGECAPLSENKDWYELVKIKPACKKIISSITKSYLQTHQEGPSIRGKQNLSATTPYFINSAIIKNQSANRLLALMGEFWQTSDLKLGQDYKVKTDDLYFGHWGDQKLLDLIKTRYSSSEGVTDIHGKHFQLDQDAKSKRFYPLGNANWEEIIQFSAAEPGLSSAKVYPKEASTVSAGGWVNLHPTLMLKALGCANVLYITRKGGESVFAQQVANRLLHFSDFKPEIVGGPLNRVGDPTNLTGPWSELYNLANPKSSLAKSIGAADAVWCTDWDSFSPTKGFANFIGDSYKADRFLNTSSATTFLDSNDFLLTFEVQNKKDYPGCLLPNP